MSEFRAALLVLATAFLLTASSSAQQTSTPRLADYFRELPLTVLDAGWNPRFKSASTATEDLNGDGNQDVVVLGAEYPLNGETNPVPQPGRVFLGDGDGHFSPAPAALFPIDTLMTVNTRKTLFADFNGDGRPDMFLSNSGWDVIIPTPQQGEQNRLYLSLPEGGWRDATNSLPQLEDYSHTSAVGDISGRGVMDIFVGNGHPGKYNIRPYTLLNTGSGNFTQMSSNIPAGPNQLLDPLTAHRFVAATLADLDGDGLPELIIGTAKSNSNQKLLRSLILWNRAGVFSETDVTELPLSAVVSELHIDYDVQPMDVDQDGLPDLVLAGIPGANPNRGWFVQVLMNKGNRRFVDETADRVLPGEAWGGLGGGETEVVAYWVRVVDFNQDGAPDFMVAFQPGGGTRFTREQPLVWINDGTGHFSTLKVGDFVAAGRESVLGGIAHLMATRNGYSFITLQYDSLTRTGGLKVTGVLATKPYRTPVFP